MKHLKSLDLKNTGVADLSFLQGMEALEELDLSGNPIEDYSPADALGIKYTVD
jgi:Leucine-rich repeat (LRR) protein